MVKSFVEVCRRKGLKVNAGKSKVLVLDGEEGLECEVYIDRIHLEHVSEFKYFGCVLYESGTNLEIMENDRIAKRVYVGDCAGNHSEGRQPKRWINTVKECLIKEKGFGCQASKENGGGL